MEQPRQFCFRFFSQSRTLEHELKEIREQEDEMLAGQRGSRLAKWIAASDSVRQQAGLTAPEAMKCLGFGSSILWPMVEW